MAINTKKKQELTEMKTVPQDKENASKYQAPVSTMQQNVCSYISVLNIIILYSILINQ